MKRLMLGLLVAAMGLGLWSCGPRTEKGGEEILVLCGGSMRAALEELVKRYSAVSHDRIIPTYGDSGALCAQIQKTGRGDLYLCHDPFMPWAAKQGLISKWAPVARLEVVLIVPKGNPKNIHEVKDLARPGLRIGLGDQRYSTSGQVAKFILSQEPWGPDVYKNVRMETKGHQQRCNDVVMGTLDASLVWNAVARLYADKLEIIPVSLEKYDALTSPTYKATDITDIKVTLGIIQGAEKRPAVVRFYEFATTDGLKVFDEFGFSPARKVVK
jgi:molybdate transport system substrate-binding protein